MACIETKIMIVRQNQKAQDTTDQTQTEMSVSL